MTIKKTKEEGSLFFFSFFLGFCLNSSYVLLPRRRLDTSFYCPSLKEKKNKNRKKEKKAEKKPKRRTNEFRKPNHEGIFLVSSS
ncbi:unnamed protein product [Brassica rapa subsp. trilocularis]